MAGGKLGGGGASRLTRATEIDLRALVEQHRPRQPLIKKARFTKFLTVELPGRRYRLHVAGAG